MSENLNVRIKYFHPDLKRVEKISVGDWIDLRAAETVTLKAGEFYQVPLGVAMELPNGYEAWLTSRSSMCKKYGIVHVDDCGVIDNSYCGDNDQWFLPVMAVRDTTIKFNERICQFRLCECMPKVQFEEVTELGNPDRGGLGSTGSK